MDQTLSMQKAVDVFIRGFSTTRSFTSPYNAKQIGNSVWLLADATEGKAPERTSEVVTYGTQPEEVVQLLKIQPIARHFLCVMLGDSSTDAETSSAYKRLGYRLLGREHLFALQTAQRTHFEALPVRRITETSEASAVAKAARSRQVLPQHLTQEDSVCRLYAAFDTDKPVGWVRSIRTHPDSSWVSNLFVMPAYRRQGIGSALMSTMLEDDARYGVEWSVLLASLTGAKLYPHLGYVNRGLLLMFSPVKPR